MGLGIGLALDAAAPDYRLPDPKQGEPGTRLLQAAHVVHQGSFALPGVQDSEGRYATEWAQGVVAYNPARNSIFFVGHDWGQEVAEFSIPAIGGTATLLQPFMDPAEGRKREVDPGDPGSMKIGGMLVVGDKLIFSVYNYYDADGSARASHFVRPIDLSTHGQVVGPFRVGTLNPGLHAGYFADVPLEWRGALRGAVINGQCCLGIISRSSFGPAAFVPDMTQMLAGQPTKVAPLVYHPAGNPLAAWEATSPLFNGTTIMRGLLLPAGSRSLLFVGRHGTGTFCYGNATECPDPSNSDKGVHAYPYQPQVWAYDMNDILKVRDGKARPWQIRPYAVWRLPGLQTANVGGVAYDMARGLIYVVENLANGPRSVVHVFTIAP